METNQSPPIVVRKNAEGCEELKLSGDIDVMISLELHGECIRIARQGGNAIIDCENVRSFDTASLQILSAFMDVMTLQGRDLRIVGVSPALAETIQLAGLTKILLK
jgi:anti-anti-sigma factor